MKTFKQHYPIYLALLFVSIIIYFIQLTVFKDAHDTFFYLLQDLAFLPINALFVTLVLEQAISSREKNSRLENLNMVIGVFFSEVGFELVKYCSSFDSEYEINRRKLCISDNWTDQDFDNVGIAIKNHKFHIDSSLGSLDEFKDFLKKKRDFLLNLLGNPILLEHDVFSDLLWSVFHISDELNIRKDFNNISKEDHTHLSNDINRVYGTLIYQWLLYSKHLKSNYPYLFSLIVKKNPYRNYIKS